MKEKCENSEHNWIEEYFSLNHGNASLWFICTKCKTNGVYHVADSDCCPEEICAPEET